MDGISEESPLATVLLLWDHAERLLERRALMNGLIWTAAHVAIFGFRRELIVPLVILLYEVYGNTKHIMPMLWKTRQGLAWSIATILSATLASIWLRSIGLPHGVRSDVVLAGPAKPYLVPCRTTHTRFFPKKHSFSYSYLLVGVPVESSPILNDMLSVDTVNRRGWFHVDSADYLERGSVELGLRGKLDNFLASQGADPSNYPHAYLLTAARFMGYHFNPVSFWYLYSQDRTLSAIVLEVNNTFGERRPYLVLRDFGADASDHPTSNSEPGQNNARARIKSSWSKDFHVSPFNSRKGDYSLLASDPLGSDMGGFHGIDITINLKSSKGHPKLVARLFSEGDAVEPASMSWLDRVRFLAVWFWVGFVTFPRIVKEAFTLFYKRGLHVWYRPEPLKDSMGRYADASETFLEVVFRRYLRHLVEHALEPLTVRYTPSGIPDAVEETFISAIPPEPSKAAVEVHIKVLTPVFYTRFIGYAHDFEAIFCELAESCTVWVDEPALLPKIFLKKPTPPLETSSLVDFFLLKVVKGLRQRPPAIKRPMTSTETAAAAQMVDIRGFRMSSMDAFLLGLGPDESSLTKMYEITAIQIFIAQRFFYGFIEVTWILMAAFRLGLSAAAAAAVAWTF